MGFFGDLFEDSGLSDVLSVGRWVTLSNGSRVKVNGDGRVVAGLPSRFHGAHVRDLPTLFRREREIGSVDCDAETACDDCPTTFRDKEQAVAALLDANPLLRDFLQDNYGSDSHRYRAWVKHGRRGKKPELAAGDGRFDALNERWELKGPRRVSSWLEAVYVTVPSSKRWADLEYRLPVLSEATGFDVYLPAEAERAHVGKLDADACRERVDAELDALFTQVRDGRLRRDGDADAVPF